MRNFSMFNAPINEGSADWLPDLLKSRVVTMLCLLLGLKVFVRVLKSLLCWVPYRQIRMKSSHIQETVITSNNCFTWARGKLAMLGIVLQRREFDFWVALPMPHLKGGSNRDAV